MKPSQCPNCGRELKCVHDDMVLIYIWSSDKEMYEEEERISEVYCPYCDTGLYSLFPKGIKEKKND
jgi:hypothetical protein